MVPCARSISGHVISRRFEGPSVSRMFRASVLSPAESWLMWETVKDMLWDKVKCNQDFACDIFASPDICPYYCLEYPVY